MSEDNVPSADLAQVHQAASTIVPSKEKLARTAEARRDRDLPAAYDAWRRWP